MKTLPEKVHQDGLRVVKGGDPCARQGGGGDGAAGSASGRGRRGGKQLVGRPALGAVAAAPCSHLEGRRRRARLGVVVVRAARSASVTRARTISPRSPQQLLPRRRRPRCIAGTLKAAEEEAGAKPEMTVTATTPPPAKKAKRERGGRGTGQ